MAETFEQRAREVVALLAEERPATVAANGRRSRAVHWAARRDAATPSGFSACQRLHSVELAIVVRALHGPNAPGMPAGAGACRQLLALIHERMAHEPAGPPQGRIPECEARRYSSEPHDEHESACTPTP